MTPRVAKQSKYQKSPAGRAVARRAYERNMALLKAWKETHPCANPKCGKSFPHYMMAFGPPPKGKPSIPVLAVSRCSAEVLTKALKKSKVFCANCRAAMEYQKSAPAPRQALQIE